jgi:hypothetical protein
LVITILLFSVNASETTCSSDAARLGSGQTTISYSFYEGDTYDTFGRDYFAGVETNLRGAITQFMVKSLFASNLSCI